MTSDAKPDGLIRFDLPTIFRCATELAESTAAMTEAEWATAPGQVESTGLPHQIPVTDRDRRLERIAVDSARLKKALGAPGLHGNVTDNPGIDGPWESYDQFFNNAAHDRSIRLALMKLATASIYLSGFAVSKELDSSMRQRGRQLLVWGLAQMWDGMSTQEQQSASDCLERTALAVEWPVDLENGPNRYDGPEDIPFDADWEFSAVNYVARPMSYAIELATAESRETTARRESFLHLASMSQFIDLAERTLESFELYRISPGESYYETAFDSLACLSMAHGVQPYAAWSTNAGRQRALIANAADSLLQLLGFNTGSNSAPNQEDIDTALRQFATAVRTLNQIENSEIRRADSPTGADGIVGSQGPNEAFLDSEQQSIIAVMNLYTDGIADVRIRDVDRLRRNDNLNVNEKLTEINALIPIPPTASAEMLGKFLRVTKQAVLKTDWWDQNRKDEKAVEISRRRARHQRRAREYERSDPGDT
jgi:hypothetical protein